MDSVRQCILLSTQMCAGFRSVVRTSPCTVGLGSPTRCPRCHASLEMVTFACVYSLCLYIGRFSCHVHYSRLVLSLTHLVSLALSKDHTTVMHTQLYVCIYHCSNCKETTEVRRKATWEKGTTSEPQTHDLRSNAEFQQRGVRDRPCSFVPHRRLCASHRCAESMTRDLEAGTCMLNGSRPASLR